MAHCPACGETVSAQQRYCPRCGTAQRQARAAPEQLSLPGIGWSLGPLAMHPDGTAALPGAGAATGRPLTGTQVAIAVGLVLLALLGIIFYAGYRPGGGGTDVLALPVLGVVGQPITVGDTDMGVAFVTSPERLNGREARNGRYLAVGVVVGNRGSEPILLDANAFAITDRERDGQHRPMLTAYGTPEELNAGAYRERYSLAPGEAVAGVVLFDIAAENTQPHLLVRDLTAEDEAYTGRIDLTRSAERQQGTPRGFIR